MPFTQSFFNLLGKAVLTKVSSIELVINNSRTDFIGLGIFSLFHVNQPLAKKKESDIMSYMS